MRNSSFEITPFSTTLLTIACFASKFKRFSIVVALTANSSTRSLLGKFSVAAALLLAFAVGTRNKFRFTGEALDPGTGLFYLRARYYDPSVGRFINRDPTPGSVAVPLTKNRYQYSRANPVRYSDPSGLSAIDNNNTSASLILSCGVNCQMLASTVIDFLKSAATTITQLYLEGASEAQSLGGAAGSTVLELGSAIVNNPDTVTSQINYIRNQPALIREYAGDLPDYYSKQELDNAVGEVCSDSVGGVCLRGIQYVEMLVMKSATEQGLQPGFQSQ